MTTAIDEKTLETLAECLQEVGLNLMTTLSARALGAEIWLERAITDGGTILLLGNGGQAFWRHSRENWPGGEHPVDEYSARVSAEALQQHLPNVQRTQLFPRDDCPVVLQRLMLSAGWHSLSPLGMGMHTEYGLWSACRAVWWLGAEVVDSKSVDTPVDRCASCVAKPCLEACPAGALSAAQSPNLSACADHRLSAGSSCERSCVARVACPVAADHRYTTEQLNYHYDLALSAIARYRSD